MERALFREHFLLAASRARDFARKFVAETLPDAMRFRVHLNGSYDATASSEFVLFPEDSAEERTLATKRLDTEGVVDLLWRDGLVPQWIDVAVVSEMDDRTVLDVTACGRFIADERSLYYTWTDVPPFGVKGPTLPIDYVEGQPFSIHARVSAWFVDEPRRAGEKRSEVWSLELHGSAFDDEVLGALPTFPTLEILELGGVALGGPALAALSRLPRLRHLRAQLRGMPELDLAGLPSLPTLRTLSLLGLPGRVRSLARLSVAAPHLEDLTLGGAVELEVDGVVSFETLEHLTLAFPRIPRWTCAPKSLRSLSMETPGATDADVAAVLSACPDTLESVQLRAPHVTEALLAEMEWMPRLRRLDVVGTRIPVEALERFAARRPGLSHFPRRAMQPKDG